MTALFQVSGCLSQLRNGWFEMTLVQRTLKLTAEYFGYFSWSFYFYGFGFLAYGKSDRTSNCLKIGLRAAA